MAAQVNRPVHNIELTDRLKEYVTRKAARLDRYLDAIEAVQVDLSYVKSARSTADRQVAQITVRGKGVLLRAAGALGRHLRLLRRRPGQGRAPGGTLQREALAQSRRRTLGLSRSRRRCRQGLRRRSTRQECRPAEDVSPQPDGREPRRSQQMELLGHEDFFLFLNVDTESGQRALPAAATGATD